MRPEVNYHNDKEFDFCEKNIISNCLDQQMFASVQPKVDPVTAS